MIGKYDHDKKLRWSDVLDYLGAINRAISQAEQNVLTYFS